MYLTQLALGRAVELPGPVSVSVSISVSIPATAAIRHAGVTSASRSAPVHTAWMPRSYSSGDVQGNNPHRSGQQCPHQVPQLSPHPWARVTAPLTAGVSGTQWSARPPRPVPAGRAWRLRWPARRQQRSRIAAPLIRGAAIRD